MPAAPSSRHIAGPSEFASHWPLSGHIEGPSKPAGIQHDGFPKVAADGHFRLVSRNDTLDAKRKGLALSLGADAIYIGFE